MRLLRKMSGNTESADLRMRLGLGRPVPGGAPLADVGDLPGGGVLAQMGNSCGTCSLSAVLRHFGVERTPAEIDREIRNADIYTAPDLMVSYARSAGLEAVFRNRGTLEEVRGFVERGIPVVLLVDPQPGKAFRLHYVTAISFRDADDGPRTGVYNPWGLREEITTGELSNIWDDVRVGPFSCWEAAFVAVAPGGTDLGPNRKTGARGVNMLGLAAANAVNGVFHVFRDRRLSRGLLELAGAFPGFLAGLVLLLRERSERVPRGPAHS